VDEHGSQHGRKLSELQGRDPLILVLGRGAAAAPHVQHRGHSPRRHHGGTAAACRAGVAPRDELINQSKQSKNADDVRKLQQCLPAGLREFLEDFEKMDARISRLPTLTHGGRSGRPRGSHLWRLVHTSPPPAAPVSESRLAARNTPLASTTSRGKASRTHLAGVSAELLVERNDIRMIDMTLCCPLCLPDGPQKQR